MAALRIAYWLPVLVWACRDRRRVSTWLEVRNLSGVTIQVPRGMAGRSVIDQVRFGQGFGEPFSKETVEARQVDGISNCLTSNFPDSAPTIAVPLRLVPRLHPSPLPIPHPNARD